MLLPVLLLLLIGLIEFSFVWNSRNTILFASRDGSMLAAEGGSIDGTDCVVLNRVESDVVSPARSIQIQQVVIYWSDRNGDLIGANQNVYGRTGSTTCTYPDGSTITVPYTIATSGYIESARCDVLAGCGGSQTPVELVRVQGTHPPHRVDIFAPFTRNRVNLP